MAQYIFKRLLLFIPVAFFVVTVVFFLLRLIPGDPVDFILGDGALPEAREYLVRTFHFDDSLWQQYTLYLKQILSGQFGQSFFSRQNVTQLLWSRFFGTFYLAVVAILMAVGLSLPFGILAAVYRASIFDRSTLFFSLFGISIPGFYLGPLLALLFSIRLDWLPLSGRDEALSVILPALTLGLAMSALLVRFTRSSVLEVLQRDYVRTARAKGITETAVVLFHAFRTALIPILSILGLQFGTLVAGTVVTEKIFNWPGLGTLLLEAISTRDYAIVQGCLLLIAFSYVVVNFLTDILMAMVDPRAKEGIVAV